MLGLGPPLKLRAVRLERRLTLEQLSETTGLSTGHLSEIERGIHRAGPAVVDALARAFDRDPASVQLLCDETYAAGSARRGKKKPRKEARRAQRRTRRHR